MGGVGMIKSQLYVECLTNKLPGLPQENIFMEGIFRKPEDYSKPFSRSAASNSDFQVCAVLSARGPDSMAATALQKLAKAFSDAVERARSAPVRDVNLFSVDLVQSLSNVAEGFTLAKKDISLQISFTASIIYEDMLYIISLGNTRAYLLHDRKWIPLTEDDTVANQRFKKGELSREEAQKDPDSDILTQYIGMPLRDGKKLVPTKARYKLSQNDEVFLLGVGIVKNVSETTMSFIANQEVDLPMKTAELIKASAGGGAKGGLSVVALRIDEALSSVPVLESALPPLAKTDAPDDITARYAIRNTAANMPANSIEDDPWAETNEDETDIKRYERGGDMPEKTKKKWVKRLWAILTPVILFALCALIGYFTTYAVLNWRKIEVKADPSASTTVNQEESMNTVMYSLSDNVSVLSEESTESQVLQVLSRGEPVTLISFGTTFSKVQTASGNTGYVLSLMLSQLDPTIGESVIEMTADPTPIPEFTQAPETDATEPTQTQDTEPTEITEETTQEETTSAETQRQQQRLPDESAIFKSFD